MRSEQVDPVLADIRMNIALIVKVKLPVVSGLFIMGLVALAPLSSAQRGLPGDLRINGRDVRPAFEPQR